MGRGRRKSSQPHSKFRYLGCLPWGSVWFLFLPVFITSHTLFEDLNIITVKRKRLTKATRVVDFKQFGNSWTRIIKGVVGNDYSAVSSHLASFINLCTVVACHITGWQTGNIAGAATVADVKASLITAVEYVVDVDECLIRTGQIGFHELAGCKITLCKKARRNLLISCLRSW